MQRASMTADTLVHTGKGRIIAVNLVPGGTAGKIDFYDALSATGTPMFSLQFATANGNTQFASFPFPHLSFATGLHVEFVTTAAATVQVFYEAG